MPIAIRLPNVLRSSAGGHATVQAEGATVGEVFDDLIRQHPGLRAQLLTDEGDLNRFVNVYVNGQDVRYLQGLDTPVAPADEVRLLPAMAGG